ncbi:glycoside hydrolase family 95 protein [Dyadobacter tibetensis]|uniref:glycoside hydrolase family 95 protein n=1 Tax=Dyadobacter tibetensis TaxID=1211851 RepID=UPI0004724405|nr:glycoside hydrolase family 95 protein [Dyadobacter tibetensis]
MITFDRLTSILLMSFWALSFSSYAETDDPRLWYTQASKQWEDALPVGNGRLAAMVYGTVGVEHIQFNEETLWTGQPRSYAKKGAFVYLQEIRNLLSQGRQKEAEALAETSFMGVPLRQMAYQAFGDIYIDFEGHDDYTQYKRSLDLSTALARVSYLHEGTIYTREIIASYPDQAIYVNLTNNRKAEMNFKIRLDALHGNKTVSQDGRVLTLDVKVDGGVLEGMAKMKILTDGKVLRQEDGLVVKGATQATLVLAAATNFIDYKTIGADARSKVTKVLDLAPEYADARKRHIKDYQQLFGRFSFFLPSKGKEALPTDQRLLAFKEDSDDPGLLSLYVQYARYLLIASSRPGSQPANLQGKWNYQLKPSWDSKYTLNINTEMNYWPVEMTNLSECHEPLFNMIRDLSETGSEVAKEHYNASGWLVHHNTDLWRGAAPINASNHGIWVTGGAWLCHHLWEHYQYTKDSLFLKETAYPLMSEAARFFVDFLQYDPNSGWLISSPSNSPENGGLVAGPTMDHQIIRSLFLACIEASRLLGEDPVFRTKLMDLVGKIAPNQIGQAGQLQEWLTDIDDTTSQHRHISHLWGLYPGSEISPDTSPELAKAAGKSLFYRGDGGTGWSLAWKINFQARLLQGNHAYGLIKNLLNPIMDASVKKGGGGTYPNLFDAHPPFQIDGNFGGAAGILELLVQSHQGNLHLLPALPDALSEGEITGLVTRGAFELSMSWKENKLVEVELVSKKGGVCTLRYLNHSYTLQTLPGKRYRFGPELTRFAK